MRQVPTLARALAALFLLAACDKFPGFGRRRAAARSQPAVIMGPWLLDPAADAMTVAWVSDAPSLGSVWYGTGETNSVASEPGAPVTDHRVDLTGLQPKTQYRYRIDGSDASFAFTTAPEPAENAPFKVLVYGDNRTNGGDHALVARAAAAEHDQLALHTGDMLVNARDQDRWRIWFREEHELLAHTPLVATVGNHEITDNGVAYSRWFQHRNRPPYWSVDYGPLHVVVLDSFEQGPGATPRSAWLSDAQKAWFEEDLKKVPKDRHVWVLVHQGPYAHPVSPRPGHGGSEAVRSAIAMGRLAHPIEVVFAGHEHFYERGLIDGLNYFVLGGGGAPLEQPDAAFPGVLAAQRALSFASIEVCGCHVKGVVKGIGGKVIDSFTLADCPAPCGVAGVVESKQP